MLVQGRRHVLAVDLNEEISFSEAGKVCDSTLVDVVEVLERRVPGRWRHFQNGVVGGLGATQHETEAFFGAVQNNRTWFRCYPGIQGLEAGKTTNYGISFSLWVI